MKISKIILFSFLLSLLIPPQSYAEDGIWQTYGNGNEINDIAVHGNHIWCTTEESAMCWNIREGNYVQYTTKDGLISNRTKLVSIDKNGMPWITYSDYGNENNLSHYDGTSWEHVTYENIDFPNLTIKEIFCDQKGDLWLGISRVGLVRYDGTSWDTFSSENTFDDTPQQIMVDSEGVTWIAASDGLWSIDNGTWNHYDKNNGLIDDNVNCIAIDVNDRVWIGTNKGVSHYDGKVWIHYTKDDGLVHNSVKSIAFDRHGEVWIGTKGGVSRYDGSIWESYTSDNGLIANTVTDIEVDRDDNIWLCHRDVDKGVTVFDGLEMKWHTIWNTDIPSNAVNAIASDDDGVLWFAMDKGLCSYNGDSWKVYTDSDGLTDNRIRDIVIGVNNTKWIFYEKIAHAGVTCFDGTKWTTFTEEDGLGDSYVTAVSQEDENVIWFGLSEGVTVYDGTSWDRFPKNDRLISTTINSITQDNEGVFWCATDEGLTRFDGTSWWTYTEEQGLPSDKLKDVKAGNDGMLWCLTGSVKSNMKRAESNEK